MIIFKNLLFFSKITKSFLKFPLKTKRLQIHYNFMISEKKPLKITVYFL